MVMMTGSGAEPPIGGEGSRFLCGWRAMVIWSTTVGSGSLSGRSALAFWSPRSVALLRWLFLPRGLGSTDDVVSACPLEIVASGWPADPHCIGCRLSLGTDHAAG